MITGSNTAPNDDSFGHEADAMRTVRMLLVDDSPLIQRLVTDRLAAHQIEVRSISSGSLALQEMIDWSPEVVLLDLELPDGDGLNALARIKGRPEIQNIPVIALSASGDTAETVRAFELGAVDYISKPFDIAELRARVRSAVRTYRLFVMLEQRAQIDGLTGLYNRAHFDTRLQQEIAESQRFDTKLSLILCDLDRFKSVNDTFGHPFGDRVLEAFAQILLSGRLSDIACRYGGEEFAVILPRAAVAEAAGVAQRFREAIETVQWNDQQELRITASFGVADISCTEELSNRALVKVADAALYQAKQTGRNRVCVAPHLFESTRRTA